MNKKIVKIGNVIKADDTPNIKEIENRIDNMPDGFERQEDASFFKFENIHDNIIGKLMTVADSERYGFKIYTILNKATNESIRFHGTTQLDSLLTKAVIGDTVYIEYIDNSETPNGSMKIFSVGIAPRK